MHEATRERAAGLFGALANVTRLRIVELLRSSPMTVNEIAEQLHIGQSGASQHLAVLTRAGLLVAEPRGTARLYRHRGPRVAAILTLVEEFCTVHALYGAASETDEVEMAANSIGRGGGGS